MKQNTKKSHFHSPGEACAICGGVEQPKSNKNPTSKSTSSLPNKNKHTLDELRHKIVSIVGKNPDKASTILSDWINASQKKNIKNK